MKIEMTLVVSTEDADATHPMGITAEANDRLVEALMIAGFEIDDGPTAVDE